MILFYNFQQRRTLRKKQARDSDFKRLGFHGGKQNAKYSSPSCNLPSCQSAELVRISSTSLWSTKKFVVSTDRLLFTVRWECVTKSMPEAAARRSPWSLIMAMLHLTPAMLSRQRTAIGLALTIPHANVFSPSQASRHRRLPTPTPLQLSWTTSCVIHSTSPAD